jgi:DNA-binding NarL/FixJ family response regulator
MRSASCLQVSQITRRKPTGHPAEDTPPTGRSHPDQPAESAPPTGGKHIRSGDGRFPTGYASNARHATSGAHVIRVLVIDDEALIRTGFTHILNTADDIEVVAAVPGGQALATVRELHPDVVLLDIRMPDVDGLTVLTDLRHMPDPPVVAMLTTFDADEYVANALRTGAAGFLLKDTDPEQLPYLVRALAEGGTVLSSRVTRTVVDGYLDKGEREPAVRLTDRLTERERAVLVLMAEGLANVDIGERMHLSAGTIKGHVSCVLSKLEVSSRVQAALIAERAGLLGPSQDGDSR